METVVSIFKISGAVTALIALIALALHLIFNKRSFFRLYRRGYMVTHPGHKAVMFKKLTDARSFIKRSARHGNDCNIGKVLGLQCEERALRQTRVSGS